MKWSLSLLLAVAALAGCALPHSVSDGDALPGRAPLQLVHGGRSPDVDALVADFFGGAWTLDDMKARARKTLAAHPSSGPAHEVAGYLALLDGNDRDLWWHLMLAAADLDAPTEAYLPALSAEVSDVQRAAGERFLEEVSAHHPRAEARARAAFELVQLYLEDGRTAAAQRQLSSLGLVDQWRFIGPFDNDQGKGFLTVYPPEQSLDKPIDQSLELPGRLVPVRWRTVERLTPHGAIPLSDTVYPSDDSVAYLATWVHSDGKRVVTLRLSASDPLRVWCNEALVASEELLKGFDFDNVRVRLTLNSGWNQILVKSANRTGAWALAARFTNDDGTPATGLGFTTTSQAHAAGAGEVDVRYLPPLFDALLPAGRGHFLVGRALARAGRMRESLVEETQFLEGAPDNPLALYAAALAYWNQDEQGKAIDLLDRAVTSTQGKVALLLIWRARYYAQKRLYDKAQHDLQAAGTLSPDADEVRFELAELYRTRDWRIDRCLAVEELVARAPRHSRWQEQQASCLLARGLDDAALAALERAHALEPGNAWVIDQLAGLATRRGQWSRARALLDDERRVHPTNVHLLLQLGDVWRQAGNRARAVEQYQKAAQLSPGWQSPHQRLGDLAYEIGDRKTALAEWQLAHERDPNDAQLAQHLEQLHPTELGPLQKYMPSDADIDHALSAKIKPHAGAQSILRLDDEVTQINSDGGARQLVTQVIEVANDNARDQLTAQTLPVHGSLKILQAFTLNKHNERQEASSIRGAEVRFRNLEVGSKIVLQYLFYDQPQHFLPNYFVGDWIFSSSSVQHEDSRWTILTAKNQRLNVGLQGEIDKKELDDGALRVRVFHVHGVAPMTPEPLSPPLEDVLRWAQVSTVPSWDEYVQWERALLNDAFHDTAEVRALASKLTKDQKSPREKLDQLYHFVTQDIRYQQDYETTIAGVRPHAPSQVLERGYGDCKDKAVLMIELARLVGVKLRFAILRTRTHGLVNRDVPNQSFNHAIVYVPQQTGIDEPLFMDPTSTDLDMGALRPDDQGATSLVLDVDTGGWKFMTIPFQTAAAGAELQKIAVAIKSPTEALATDDWTFHGPSSMYVRKLVKNRSLADKLFARLIAGLFTDGTLTTSTVSNDEDIWKPVTLHLGADVSSAIQPQDDRWRFTLPGSFALADAATLAVRVLPLWLGPPDEKTLDVEVTLPDGYTATHLPADIDVTHACFAVKRGAHADGQRVIVHTAFERRCSSLSVAEYPAFRTAVRQVMQRYQDDIVFAHVPTAPPKTHHAR